MAKSVAVLCVAKHSVYKRLVEADCFDEERDARTFKMDKPIIAHPPCRAWSNYCAHQAKPADGEKELGLFCACALVACGGVLEQPADSALFRAAGLPRPNERAGELWTIEVWQAWWDYPMRKATWLCFSNIDKRLVEVPLRLHAQGSDRRCQQLMSKQQRSHTTPKFAHWLLSIVRPPLKALESITIKHGQ